MAELFPLQRERLRAFYRESWARHRQGLPLEPLQALVAEVVAGHPEYQAMLEPDAPDPDLAAPPGESNPFLHLGLHVAVREQLAADRPPGLRALWSSLLPRFGGGRHRLEHALMQCLAALLWQAQRDGRPPQDEAYLECVRGLRPGR
jgi:hypothetical protein